MPKTGFLGWDQIEDENYTGYLRDTYNLMDQVKYMAHTHAAVFGFGEWSKEKLNIDLSLIEPKEINDDDYKNGNNFSFELPNSKRMVEFQLLNHKSESDIAAELKGLKKLESRTGISQEMTTRLKHLITSVDGDSNKGAIRNFVDTELLALDSRALRAEIDRLQPDVDLSFAFTCSNCGYEDVDMEIPLTAGFFWPKAPR